MLLYHGRDSYEITVKNSQGAYVAYNGDGSDLGAFSEVRIKYIGDASVNGGPIDGTEITFTNAEAFAFEQGALQASFDGLGGDRGASQAVVAGPGGEITVDFSARDNVLSGSQTASIQTNPSDDLTVRLGDGDDVFRFNGRLEDQDGETFIIDGGAGDGDRAELERTIEDYEWSVDNGTLTFTLRDSNGDATGPTVELEGFESFVFKNKTAQGDFEDDHFTLQELEDAYDFLTTPAASGPSAGQTGEALIENVGGIEQNSAVAVSTLLGEDTSDYIKSALNDADGDLSVDLLLA
ncbi:MAG: hypothetical protein AAGM38_03665 [Pseudomonadota bacterium]